MLKSVHTARHKLFRESNACLFADDCKSAPLGGTLARKKLWNAVEDRGAPLSPKPLSGWAFGGPPLGTIPKIYTRLKQVAVCAAGARCLRILDPCRRSV